MRTQGLAAASAALSALLLVVLLATGCATDDDGTSSRGETVTVTDRATSTFTATATETATERATETRTLEPRPTVTGPEILVRPAQLGGELLGTTWELVVLEEAGELCLEARAGAETDRACGDEVRIERHEGEEGGPDLLSVVELQVANLAITAGLVTESAERVRIESEPPPEDPDGGAMQEVGPADLVVGLNVYADADEAGGPLGIARVVALDATGDEIGAVEPG